MKKCMLRVKVGGWGGGEPQHRQLGCPVLWVEGNHREGALHEGASEASAGGSEEAQAWELEGQVCLV